MPDCHLENADAWVHLEKLALALICGEEGVWQSFMHVLAERAPPIVRAQWRRLDPDERFEDAHDVVHEVLVRVLPRLRRNDYRALRAYFNSPSEGRSANVIRDRGGWDGGDSSDGRSFRCYIKTILVRATLDYQRTHPNYADGHRRAGSSSNLDTSTTSAGTPAEASLTPAIQTAAGFYCTASTARESPQRSR